MVGIEEREKVRFLVPSFELLDPAGPNTLRLFYYSLTLVLHNLV